jgi:hypothetical protein
VVVVMFGKIVIAPEEKNDYGKALSTPQCGLGK